VDVVKHVSNELASLLSNNFSSSHSIQEVRIQRFGILLGYLRSFSSLCFSGSCLSDHIHAPQDKRKGNRPGSLVRVG
jgi:hypothetical protein